MSCPVISHHVTSCLAVSCRAMPCHAIPCHAMPCHATPRHAMPCHAMPCHATPCHAVPRRATSCRIMSCHIMSRHIMSHHVTSCHAMSCRVVSFRVVSCGVVSCRITWLSPLSAWWGLLVHRTSPSFQHSLARRSSEANKSWLCMCGELGDAHLNTVWRRALERRKRERPVHDVVALRARGRPTSPASSSGPRCAPARLAS